MAVAVITNAAVMVAIFSEIANRLASRVAFQATVMAFAANPSGVATCLATMTTTIATAMTPTVTTAISATMATTVLCISGRHREQRRRCQHQYAGHGRHEILFL